MLSGFPAANGWFAPTETEMAALRGSGHLSTDRIIKGEKNRPCVRFKIRPDTGGAIEDRQGAGHRAVAVMLGRG